MQRPVHPHRAPLAETRDLRRERELVERELREIERREIERREIERRELELLVQHLERNPLRIVREIVVELPAAAAAREPMAAPVAAPVAAAATAAAAAVAHEPTEGIDFGDIPNDYLCPITMLPMEDPVMCTDGHSYERSAIEEWFTRKTTSPKTGSRLTTTMVIPNIALKGAIREYIERRKKEGASAAVADTL